MRYKKFKEYILKLCFVNFLFLLFMSAYRFIFFVHFGKGAGLHGFGFDIFKMFFMGIRLDLSVIALINVPTALIFVIVFILKKFLYLNHFFIFKILLLYFSRSNFYYTLL